MKTDRSLVGNAGPLPGRKAGRGQEEDHGEEQPIGNRSRHARHTECPLCPGMGGDLGSIHPEIQKIHPEISAQFIQTPPDSTVNAHNAIEPGRAATRRGYYCFYCCTIITIMITNHFYFYLLLLLLL